MRVLFASWAWRTHFFNMVPLAWALHTAGHEVRVAGEPELVDAITGAGLTAVPVGSAETLKEKVARAQEEGVFPSAEEWEEIGPKVLELAHLPEEKLTWEQLAWKYRVLLVPKARIKNDSMVGDLVALCRSWGPDLVVWDSLTHAAPVAAATSGAAHARVLTTTDVEVGLRRNFLRMRDLAPPRAREDPMAEWLGELAGRYGAEFSEELITGHFTIDQLPESFRQESDLLYASLRYVPYNDPSVVPRWLSEPVRAPRVLMTLGMSSRDWTALESLSAEQVQETLDAVADLDIELVVTLPAEFSEKLERVPANTRVVEFVPLDAVIPSCSAVIRHGGVGGLNGSLLHGVPQLQIGSKVPDPDVKRRCLRAARAGDLLEPDEVSGPAIREALVRLLEDPAYRAGAQRLRREVLAQPTPNELVPELERLAARFRTEPPAQLH
ncbi:activator-dependent family glycosyltransferase [Actinomadura roseirufa]|uniref:activator-dependent family glycosyltransferase n=1 Tax=Actinomadura roseirufa TaxID=2094049 RepID=UPI001041ADE1|nr:activator-dependent family glycosyltransferase [Actinomadura roseirufa]